MMSHTTQWCHCQLPESSPPARSHSALPLMRTDTHLTWRHIRPRCTHDIITGPPVRSSHSCHMPSVQIFTSNSWQVKWTCNTLPSPERLTEVCQTERFADFNQQACRINFLRVTEMTDALLSLNNNQPQSKTATAGLHSHHLWNSAAAEGAAYVPERAGKALSAITYRDEYWKVQIQTKSRSHGQEIRKCVHWLTLCLFCVALQLKYSPRGRQKITVFEQSACSVFGWQLGISFENVSSFPFALQSFLTPRLFLSTLSLFGDNVTSPEKITHVLHPRLNRSDKNQNLSPLIGPASRSDRPADTADENRQTE